MSYLVLARKYRPQTFSQVVGQEHVTKTLSNAFVQDRVHHAFLFCGPRGCGKTTTARILSKALNCEKGPTPEPCGECEACTSIAGGTAVDYFEMDGASNRGIDSIRDLTEAVRYQPAVLRKKVYVIDEVHMLTTEAFNALLKTLEEPPSHVTFVMATTEPHKVPNTILSRCQRFDFKLVPSARLVAHIQEIFAKEEIPAEEGAVNLIVRESGGSVRDSLSLCDQIISYVGAEGISETQVAEVLGVADRALVHSLVSALIEQDAKTCLAQVESAISRGVDEVQIARAVVRYLRDLSVLKVAPDGLDLIEGSADEKLQLARLAQNLDASRVRRMFDRMLRTCDQLSDSDQPRLVLDVGLIDVAATEAVVPLGDLMGRLAAMERRLSAGGGPGGGGGRGGGTPGGGRTSAPSPTPSPNYSASPASSASSGPSAKASSAGEFSTSTKGASSDLSPAQEQAQGSAAPAAGQASNAAAAVSAPVAASETAPSPSPAPRAAYQNKSDSTGPASEFDLSHLSPTIGSDSLSHQKKTEESVEAVGTKEEEPPSIAEQAPGSSFSSPSLSNSSERMSSESGTQRSADLDAKSNEAVPALSDTKAAGAARASIAHPNASNMMQRWEKVMSALDENKQYGLMSVYQSAKVLEFDDTHVKVGFSAGALTAEIATSKDKVKQMRDSLHSIFKRPIDFQVSILTPEEEANALSLIESARQHAEEERERRMLEAREHPMIKMVLRTFGAAIKEVRLENV